MIKKGDNVIMRHGKDRGKKGNVLAVVKDADKKGIVTYRVVVEGLNTVKRHQRARRQGQKGQIVEKERAVAISAVQLVCPKCKKPTRLGHVKDEKKPKNKKRICRKCEATI